MGNSKSIYYEDCDENVKSMILSEFIKKYSDKKITGIEYYYHDKRDPRKKNEISIYIKTDKYLYIVFKNRLELIQLVEKIGRSFIIMGEFSRNDNEIHFVYGL
jgi:hypothetical protein